MADIIDEANDRAEFFLSTALRNRQLDANVASPAGTGVCLNCGEDVSPKERRWCDAECRNQWEREAARVSGK